MKITIHGWYEGVNENGRVNKILKSWFPLIIRRGYDSIVETATGNEVGRIYKAFCSNKMADVISKQVDPNGNYITANVNPKTGEIFKD